MARPFEVMGAVITSAEMQNTFSATDNVGLTSALVKAEGQVSAVLDDSCYASRIEREETR
jgi:hypothetical protein